MIKAIIIVSPKFAQVTFPPELIRDLQTRVDLVCDPISAEELKSRPSLLRNVEVIFTGWGQPSLDEAFLREAPCLKAVFHAAGSVKHFVSDAMWHRGIRISSAWSVNGQVVAEYTLAAILFSLKQGFAYAAACRANRRVALGSLPAGVAGSTVALISLGAAGRAVRDRLNAYNLRVVAYDPYISREEADRLGVTLVSMEEAFACSDVVSLHAPLTPSTISMIRGAHFARMRPYATFINTARGGLVHEAEMIAVMKQRSDIVAILDVTEPEPPNEDSPLLDLPNIILTPHIAGAIGRDCVRLSRCMIEEFDRWKEEAPLMWEIKRERLVNMA